MGKEKGGFMSPKAIANRIKSKGLQKLRWYCQMCQKQCRDENGFKCHMTSESHQRQLLLFAENPDEYVDTFSKDFAEEYLELLSRRFGTKRVHGNIVYQEYISDREHVHMNSTQWETLTEFVKWLGKEGKCVVDETEKGWFIKYIDRDPETIKRQEQLKAKERMDMDDEERTAKFIQQQIEKAGGKDLTETEYTELKRDNEEEKVTLSLSGLSKSKEEKVVPKLKSDPFGASSSKSTDSSKPQSGKLAGQKRKSTLSEIMEFEEQKKEKQNRKEYWLHEGIVVKVVTKKLGDKYHKKKAAVLEVKDLYKGIIKLIDSGDKLKVDQSHLETVIPGLGKTVMIVNGAYRGSEATLEKINEKKFSCTVSIKYGLLKGRQIDNVGYEDICKLHQPS